MNRKKLIEHINKQALETPDIPELEPFVAGVVRGKKWLPPPPDDKQREADEKIAIDMGDEYEQALTDASQEEIIDLAGKCLTIYKEKKITKIILQTERVNFNLKINRTQTYNKPTESNSFILNKSYRKRFQDHVICHVECVSVSSTHLCTTTATPYNNRFAN